MSCAQIGHPPTFDAAAATSGAVLLLPSTGTRKSLEQERRSTLCDQSFIDDFLNGQFLLNFISRCCSVHEWPCAHVSFGVSIVNTHAPAQVAEHDDTSRMYEAVITADWPLGAYSPCAADTLLFANESGAAQHAPPLHAANHCRSHAFMQNLRQRVRNYSPCVHVLPSERSTYGPV